MHWPDASHLFGTYFPTPPSLSLHSAKPIVPSTAVVDPAASTAAPLDILAAPSPRRVQSLRAIGPPPGAAPRPTGGTRGTPANDAPRRRLPALRSETARASARRTLGHSSAAFSSQRISQLAGRGSLDPAALDQPLPQLQQSRFHPMLRARLATSH